MDEVLRSVVLPFLCENQIQYLSCAKTRYSTRHMMPIPEHTSLGSAKSVLCASYRSVRSSDMSTILTCQRVQRIKMASRNAQPLNAVLHEISRLIPQCGEDTKIMTILNSIQV